MVVQIGTSLGHISDRCVVDCAQSDANWYVGTTAWDVIVPGDITPGYSYCRHLIAFFTSSNYWELVPSDQIVSTKIDYHTSKNSTGDAYALANPDGSELLVYLATAGSFGLKLPGGATKRWRGLWFDPRSGQSVPLANISSASPDTGFIMLHPPSMCDHGDVALRLVVEG